MSKECSECLRLKEQVRILQVNNDALKKVLDEKRVLLNAMVVERETFQRLYGTHPRTNNSCFRNSVS